MHALEGLGIDVGEILESRDLSVETVDNPDVFVQAIVMYSLVEAAGDAAGIRGFCTSVAENLDLSSWFPGADVASEAVTVGDLMARFTIASPQQATSAVHYLHVEGDRAHFNQRRAIAPDFTPAHTDAFMVGLWVPVLHSALGDGWDASQVVVAVSDPDALPEDFHGVKAIKGDRQGFSIAFPSPWISAQYDRRAFDRHLERIDWPVPASKSLVAALRQALKPHLAQPNLNAERAAELCGFNKSTLKRKLAVHRTTIFRELEKMKMEVAIDALLQADRSIDAIAASVGYADPTVFSRAFKRWTGDSPRAYQKNNVRED
jgi:AraC-like DNA-binding protein